MAAMLRLMDETERPKAIVHYLGKMKLTRATLKLKRMVAGFLNVAIRTNAELDVIIVGCLANEKEGLYSGQEDRSQEMFSRFFNGN